jgi:hypothetical protein
MAVQITSKEVHFKSQIYEINIINIMFLKLLNQIDTLCVYLPDIWVI